MALLGVVICVSGIFGGCVIIRSMRKRTLLLPLLLELH